MRYNAKALVVGWIVFIALCITYGASFVNDSAMIRKFVKEDVHSNMTATSDPVVVDLVSKYLVALTECDVNSLSTMVTSPELCNKTALLKRAEVITAYSNLSCYTKEGADDQHKVVIVVSDVSLKNVNSVPKDMMTLYLVETASGDLIVNETLDSQALASVQMAQADKDVKKLTKQIYKYNKKLADKDANLKSLYAQLNQGTLVSSIAVDEEALKGENTTYGLLPQQEEWNLILVNKDNPLPDGYEDGVEFNNLSNGKQVDKRCYSDLNNMLRDCENSSGSTPIVCSAYRSIETQQELLDQKIAELIAGGRSEEEAIEKAKTIVTVPGCSEHNTGLAMDIVDTKNQILNKDQADTEVQQWLMQHSWEYGFVLRYPEDKEDITDIIYEPWHYRYVGLQAAREMHESGQCLEEYIYSLSQQ